MLHYIVNGLIRTFGRELIEEWIPLDHVCVTSVSNPEIHIANISIPDVVFRNYSSPFALVSSNIRRIVVKCDWSALFRNNKRGKIKIDVDGVDLVVRTKRLEEFDPELCKNSLLKKKRNYLDKWLKFSNLGPNSDKAARFVNALSIRARNVKITFVDDVIYKHPFSIVIKADLVTGGGADAKNPNMTDLERNGFLKSFLTYLLFKSKGVQIEYNSYETDFYSYQTPNHETNQMAEDAMTETEEEGDEVISSSSSSHFSDDLFQSDFSEQEELEKMDLNEFLQVKRSNFCSFCSGNPQIRTNRIKKCNMKYLDLLNTPHKRFKLTTKEGIYVCISVKIWNFNSLFFVDKIAFEPMQKVKLFLCGNDPEYTNQEHYGYLFDGSVKYSQLKLNFHSEFVHTLHDFIRYVRILSCFKQAATASCWKVPNLQNAMRYCKLLKRSKLFKLSKDDKEFFDDFERETSLGILIRLHNFMYKKRNRKRIVFGNVFDDNLNRLKNCNSNESKTFFGFRRNKTKRFSDPEEDLGIKIESLFKEEGEYEDEYTEQFDRNFVNIQADEYESNFFNRKYYFDSDNNKFGGNAGKTDNKNKEKETKKEEDKDSNNWDDWFLGNLSFGIIAPNLRVDLVPTTKAFETLLKSNSYGNNLGDFKSNLSREVLDCLIAELSCFHFNIVQMSERRSSIKIFLSRPMCRYGKVESLIKRRSFSCDLILGNVFNEKMVAGPMRLLNDYNGFFEDFENENVNNFSVEDFSKIEKHSLISIVIETYVNFVRKNLINMCPVFLVANNGLELYKSLEPNLMKRTLNELLSLEVFLHRSFLTSDYSVDGYSSKNYLTRHYLASTYMSGNYPLKNNTNYDSDEIVKVGHFLDNLDDKLRSLVGSIKNRIRMKNRNLVSFTGMEMKAIAFFGNDSKKRARSDARDMYDRNELVLNRWPYQKGVDYYYENNGKKRNSNQVSGNDLVDETKRNDVLVTILDAEARTPRNSRDNGVFGRRTGFVVEENCLDWFYNSKRNPFVVKSLDLGDMDSIEATVGSIEVFVDSYTTSKKVDMNKVDVSLVRSDPKSIFGGNPKCHNSADHYDDDYETQSDEKFNYHEKVNLLNLDLFSLHLIKKTSVFMVRLEEVDVYSNLLQLVPLAKYSEACAKSFSNVKDMVNALKSGSCFFGSDSFFLPKPDFSFSPSSLSDTAEFGDFDPVKASKTIEMETSIFNFLVCYCSPVYEGDLVKFGGNNDVNLLLSFVGFRAYLMNRTNHFTNNNSVLYSLILHKFTVEFLKGAKEKVKLDLRGANLLNYSCNEPNNEYNNFCSRYQDSISTDYGSSDSGDRMEDRDYEVLIGCSMSDLKNNKVTVKRVQYGQVLFQLEKFDNNMDLKVELRSFNIKYNQGFFDYIIDQYSFLSKLLSKCNLNFGLSDKSVGSSISVDELSRVDNYESLDNDNLKTNEQANKQQSNNEKNFKIYLSSLNTCVYLENFGVVLDVFCNFTKKGPKLMLNVTRLSTGLLWSNYRRLLTLSMIELQFKIDDYTVFKSNKNYDNSVYLNEKSLKDSSDNKIMVQLSQMAIWYHFNNMYNSYGTFGSFSSHSSYGTLNSSFTKFSSHNNEVSGNDLVDETKRNDLFYGLSLLFNEYWFSHVTWCLLPTCPDDDLLVLIFSTKVSSYSRLTPILNKNYLKHYLQLYNPDLFGQTKSPKHSKSLNSTSLSDKDMDSLIDEYLSSVDNVENFDNLQVDSDLVANCYDSVVVTKGTFNIGEFVFNVDMNMLKDMKKYLTDLKSTTNKVKGYFNNLDLNNLSSLSRKNKDKLFDNSNLKTNEEASPFGTDYSMVSFDGYGKNSIKNSLVVKVDFNSNGNVIYLFSDYSFNVPCSYLPEVSNRYKKLRFKLLQLYPQNKVLVNLSYSCSMLLQNDLDENLLYKLSKNLNVSVTKVDDENLEMNVETDVDNVMDMLNEQFYTFDGSLILSVFKSNLFLDFYTNHPYNMDSNLNGLENNLSDPNFELKQKFEFKSNYNPIQNLKRLSSVKLFDDPVDEYEIVKILNLSLYDKKLHFVKNEDKMLVKLMVDKLQVLDYFGKYLLENVYDTRLRASQVYDIPEELLSKNRGQLIVSLSKSINSTQLDVVVNNTLTELQPDFVNLLLSVFLNNKDKLFDNSNLKTNEVENKQQSNNEKGKLNNELELVDPRLTESSASELNKQTPKEDQEDLKKKFKFSLSLNMYEIWIYPIMEFYTRTKDESARDKTEQKLRVTPKIFKTATEYVPGANNPLGNPNTSNFEGSGNYYSRYYDDRIHVLCLLFSGTVSNTNNYCRSYIKYFSTTLGTVLLLENNYKVLVDQNDGLIISKVVDPCNRFLLELKDFLIKFKMDKENVLLQSHLGNIKLCASIEDVVRLYYLKDYFYPVVVNDVVNSFKAKVYESVDNSGNLDLDYDDNELHKFDEFEFHDVDDVFKSFGVSNIDESNKTTEVKKKSDKNEKINKAFKFLDKLYYSGNKKISVNFVIGGFQAIMVTAPNSLILGVLVYQFNLEFLHGSQNIDNYAMFSLSFLFDVSLLNNKFVTNDYLLQTTPLKLELMSNCGQDDTNSENVEALKELTDTILVIKMELGAAVVDFSNNMNRLVKYLVTALKKIKEIEKSMKSSNVTVYNELDYDICIFSGNVKRELDYFIVPTNTSVKLFTKEFTLLIRNQDNKFSNCDNILGYVDKSLLFGNTNDVKDFLNLHNYSNNDNINSSKKKRLTISRMSKSVNRVNMYSGSENSFHNHMSKVYATNEYEEYKRGKENGFIYLGRFEGNENVLKLPGYGEMILIEQMHDKVIVSTNIKIENLTDISFVISCSKQENDEIKEKMMFDKKNKKNKNEKKEKDDGFFKKVQFDVSDEFEIILDKFNSAGIPISWYNNKHLPMITYSNKLDRKEDMVQFEILKNILNNPVGSTGGSSGNGSSNSYSRVDHGNGKNKKEEYLLRFKNGLCFRTTVTSIVVNDVNEVDCMKYIIRIEPMFKIFNKLPYDLVVCFSTVKNNSKVNFKNINFDLLLYDKIDSMSLVQNSGAVKELKPNQYWGIPVYNNKFYIKLILKGISLLNSNSCRDDDDKSSRMDSRLTESSASELNKQTPKEDQEDGKHRESTNEDEQGPKNFRGSRFRESVERYSLMEYLKNFNVNEINENDLVYISDTFEINLPNSGNLFTTKSLNYKSGPIFETTFRHLEPLLCQDVYNKNKEAFYQVLKKNFVNIRLNRNKVSVFWPYIFENYTNNFLCFNGNLIPPNFKFFTTTSEATDSKLRAYVKNHNDQYVPTKEVHKLDFTSTTSNRPPINLVLTGFSSDQLNKDDENMDEVIDSLIGNSSLDSLDNDKGNKNKKDKELSRLAECLSLGCSVRALSLSSYPTRVVVFHYYYTFLNKMPYDLVVRNSNVGRTVIRSEQTVNVNSLFKQVKLAVHKPVSNDGSNKQEGRQKKNKEVFLFAVTLNPSKIPLHVQLKPKKLKIENFTNNKVDHENQKNLNDHNQDDKDEENKFILDVSIVEGKFDFGLPCKFNGLYYIISIAAHTTFQLLNLTKYNLFVVDPNYIFTSDNAADSSNFVDDKKNKKKKEKKEIFKILEKSKELEDENTLVLYNLKLTPFVLYKNDDRRVAFKNDCNAKWLIYNIDTLKNIQTYQLQTFVADNTDAADSSKLVDENQQQKNELNIGLSSNGDNNLNNNSAADENSKEKQQQTAVAFDSLEEKENKHSAAEKHNAANDVYVSCVMKNDGTRVICFVDDYVLLCKLLQRVELLQMNRITSVWSKILFTLTTPRITTTMSSKKKLVLAAHINNLYFNVILNNSTSLTNFNNSRKSGNKYSLSGRNDWIMEVNASIKGCHVDHFVQGFIPVILKALNNRHSVQESFLVFKMTCNVFSKTIQTFDSIYFKLSPISMNVEMRVIEQIVDYFESLSSESSFIKDNFKGNNDDKGNKNKKEKDKKSDSKDKERGPVACYVDSKKRKKLSKKYIKMLKIEPITIVLAIRTSDVKLSREGLQLLDALPLDTPSVSVHFFSEQIVQTVCTYDEMLSLLKNSYFKQLVRQSLPSAWLSNSLAVLYGIIKGFLYFFTQPFSCCKKFKNTVEGFFLGINNGIKYLVLFVVGGFAQSIGHLLNIFYKIMGRGRAKPIGILDGLWLGMNSLVLDVFYNPWNRLVTEFNIGFGPKRLLRNSYNVFKCLISPVSALVNLMVTVVEGLSNVLLGDFEQFTHLYETEQLSSNAGNHENTTYQSSQETDGKKNELLRRVKTVSGNMMRMI